MAMPTTKLEFIEYCLRQLGKPVIQINIADEQADDAYEEAVRYWNEHHMDGSERGFYAFPIDQAFLDTTTVKLPNTIYSVNEMFGVNAGSTKDPTFDVEYHMTSDALWSMMKNGGSGMLDFYLTKSYLAEMNFQLQGIHGFNYNYHTGTFRINTSSSKFTLGSTILLDVMTFIDPEEYPSVFRDTWLINYTITLLKLRWGNNLKKFAGVALPGGVSLNGEQIYMEASQEKERLERECSDTYNLPLGVWIG